MVMKSGDQPGDDQQRGRIDQAGDIGRDDEDAGADHRAHHQRGGAGQAQPFDEFAFTGSTGVGVVSSPRSSVAKEPHSSRRDCSQEFTPTAAQEFFSNFRRASSAGRRSRRPNRRRPRSPTRALARVMPPMATSGFCVAARAARNAFEPDHRIGIAAWTWWRTPDRRRCSPPGRHRPACSCSRLCVETPRIRPVADDRARAFGRKVVLPDMDAVVTGGHANVGAVVHDQRDCRRRAARRSSRAWLSISRRAADLIAVLNERRAAGGQVARIIHHAAAWCAAAERSTKHQRWRRAWVGSLRKRIHHGGTESTEYLIHRSSESRESKNQNLWVSSALW